MKIENYFESDALDSRLKKYNSYIVEYFTHHQHEFLYGQKRDNCGVIAADFSLFMQTKNIEIERIHGEFITDVGSFKKLDFYKEEIIQMRDMGLEPNQLSDRMKFVEKYNLFERQKRIPHYWNVDSSGVIIDLSGYSQFVKPGLAKDLNDSRYESDKNTIKNTLKQHF